MVNGHLLRSYERPVSLAGSPQATIGGLVEVATPLDDSRPRGPVLIGLIVGIVLGGLGVLAVGWLLARIAMAPVDRLAATVDSIGSTDDLSRRLPTDAFGSVRLDGVVRLTFAFNAMLDRLQTSTEQVERSLELQRQFVGDASHQLRTPLTSLRGNVHLLSQLCAEDCPAAALDDHEAILTDLDAETERMSRLVNGLLVLARADAQQHLLLSPVDLEPLIRDAWRTAQALTDSVTVELGEVPSGVQVRADADRLLQLLVILLENAVLYSPRGSQVQVTALVESRHERPGVRVDVLDEGPGVPAEERSRIFERFYRSRRTEAAADGVGLGLAVADWIAREHEAEITVADNMPAGSVFQLWLPGERVQYAQNA
jgi:signal transduction histidine kinase